MKIIKRIAISAFAAAFMALAGCAGDKPEAAVERERTEASIENPANNANISDVNVRYIEQDSTRSIWEVLTGKEFWHGRLFIRTDNSDRTGYYFFVMFETYTKDILAGDEILLYVQPSKSHNVEKFSFKVPSDTTLLREVALGVTGKDAARIDDKILAWKIEVKDRQGNIIAQKQSWLWSVENPAAPEK